MVTTGATLALFTAIYILIRDNGFQALTVEGGFLYVTTFAFIALSIGPIVPIKAKRWIAFIVLIQGTLIFLNVILGIHLFGLEVVRL
jgi:hypothetical protein